MITASRVTPRSPGVARPGPRPPPDMAAGLAGVAPWVADGERPPPHLARPGGGGDTLAGHSEHYLLDVDGTGLVVMAEVTEVRSTEAAAHARAVQVDVAGVATFLVENLGPR